MSIISPLQTEKLWKVIADDGQIMDPERIPDLSKDTLKSLMERMLFTRLWDERAVKWTRQGKLGFYAPVSGQEASMIGSQAALRSEDFILPSYRDVPQCVWHGWPLYQAFLYSLGHQHGNQIPKGVHVLPPQIIIGAQIVQAAGVAMAFKLRKEQRVAMAYIGDGGTSQGDFYEGLNIAGVFQLPAIFFIQNNQFAISVPVARQTAIEHLSDKAKAVGIHSERVDGMDVLAVYEVTKQAVQRALQGEGSTLIEAVTFRYGPHTMSGDDPTLYRTKELEEQWKKKDPISRFRNYLKNKHLWSDIDEQKLEQEARTQLEEALDKASRYPPMTIESLSENMYAEMPEDLFLQIKQHLE